MAGHSPIRVLFLALQGERVEWTLSSSSQGSDGEASEHVWLHRLSLVLARVIKDSRNKCRCAAELGVTRLWAGWGRAGPGLGHAGRRCKTRVVTRNLLLPVTDARPGAEPGSPRSEPRRPSLPHGGPGLQDPPGPRSPAPTARRTPGTGCVPINSCRRSAPDPSQDSKVLVGSRRTGRVQGSTILLGLCR